MLHLLCCICCVAFAVLHLLCCICCVAFAVLHLLLHLNSNVQWNHHDFRWHARRQDHRGLYRPPHSKHTVKKLRGRERRRETGRERDIYREREKERERGGSERAREKSFLNYLKFAHHFSQFPNLKERCALACRLPITYLVPPTQLAMYLCPHRRQLLHYYARWGFFKIWSSTLD